MALPRQPTLLGPQAADRDRMLAQFLFQQAQRQPVQGPGMLVGNLAQVLAGQNRLQSALGIEEQTRDRDRATLAGILAGLPSGGTAPGGANLAELLTSTSPALQGVGSALFESQISPESGFTLGPGQARFGAGGGDPIASLPSDALSVDDRIRVAQAGRNVQNINVGPQGQDFGDPPKDTVWARNPDNTVATEPFTLPDGRTVQRPIAVPTVGGTVDRADTAEATAEAARAASAVRQGQIVLDEINKTLDLVRSNPATTTGTLSQVLQFLPTHAREVRNSINVIRANAAFSRIQELRSQSATGSSGLGPVTDPEREALADTVGALDQAGRSEPLVSDLERLRNAYLDAVYGQVSTITPQIINNMDLPRLQEWLQTVEQRGSVLSDEQISAVDRALTRLGR